MKNALKGYPIFTDYESTDKPLKRRSGQISDGSLRQYADATVLFETGEEQSFHGYSGVNEFRNFPLRQYFINKHKVFPCEWDTGYFENDKIFAYVEKHKRKAMSIHYNEQKQPNIAILNIGGKENIYVYVYNRGFSIEKNCYGICILFTKLTSRVSKLIDQLLEMKEKPEEIKQGYLNMLVQNDGRFSLMPIEIPSPDIDFDLNYNEDFKEVHDIILNKLKEDNSKGLVVLSGTPGTGKTTYIRYLINSIQKNIIFIPPAILTSLSDPNLINFFISQKNSILVIEEGENVLMKRNSHSSQSIANLLNLSDGLLSDAANIQVIATFNTDLSNIDDALLRKGRLIAKYEFNALNPDRAKKLSEKLGVDIPENTTLAEIFNQKEKSFFNQKEKSTLGFKKH